MTTRCSRVTHRARLGLGAIVLAGALAAALAAGAVEQAGAVKAKTIGETKDTPDPICPKKPCQAVGSVTSFQAQADGEKGLFKIRAVGHIVAWSVDLARPDAEQRDFFSDFYRDKKFGTDPQAAIAIIRNVTGTKYKLRKQSSIVELSRDLGTKPLITLNRPLKVQPGDIVALTMPTWLPAFAIKQSMETVWRASRSPKKCGPEDSKEGDPQTEVGEIRRYGCRYSEARLLYWAYFVPARGESGGGDGAKGRES